MGFLFAFVILVLFFKTNPIKNMYFNKNDYNGPTSGSGGGTYSFHLPLSMYSE